jgi:hypothetical protein
MFSCLYNSGSDKCSHVKGIIGGVGEWHDLLQHD